MRMLLWPDGARKSTSVAPASAMASSIAPAPHAEPFPGPPPTPTSLMDLPAPWRLQLATSSALNAATRLALFRTCTFYRDTVRRHRTASATFTVPLTSEDFPAELERLCTVARRSSMVCLGFCGVTDEGDNPAAGWLETEASITHLLVCAAAQLGGDQPLACVKEIWLATMEQTALVPAWLRLLCPNATKLVLSQGTFRPLDLPQPSMSHPHLQRLGCEWRDDNAPTTEHARQQLATLPSLSSLLLTDLFWAEVEEGEQQARRLISSTVTKLDLMSVEPSSTLQRLPTQFPCLRELSATMVYVEDLGLEALLSMPHLERLTVCGFNKVTRSYAHRTWQLLQLTTAVLGVETFARLPLESIQACSGLRLVHPSADAAAVARVAEAIRRWGGLGSGWSIRGSDVTALLTTVGPLIAALPAAQQQRLQIDGWRDATLSQVQQLGQQLPASVTHLDLASCRLAADALPALLPSLPASVVELRLPYSVTEQQVVAVCQAAVRPVKVVVPGSASGKGLSQKDLDRITRSLAPAARGRRRQQQQASLVTLVRQ